MVQELRKELDKDPSKLKKVYLESLKLESLQIALKKEIRVSRNRKRSMSSLVPISTSVYHLPYVLLRK